MAQTQKKVELKDVKQTLGRMDIFAIAVGQIIGAGVMTMSIAALKMTGRAVNIAFVIAAVFTIFGAIPSIFASSVLRMRGGLYTQALVFVGEKFAGFYTITSILGKLSMAMFAIGIADYLIGLIHSIRCSESTVGRLLRQRTVWPAFDEQWYRRFAGSIFLPDIRHRRCYSYPVLLR